MKRYILIFLVLNVFVTYGQDIKNLYPGSIYELDFSQDLIENFNTDESFDKCIKVWETWEADGRSYQQATSEELEILKYCDEVREDVWDIVGSACSWYCGGGPLGVTASSYLPSQSGNTYEPDNAHDLSYQSAWVEGVKGYGMGEYLLYTFDATSPRINKIIVVNGYVKSQSAWHNNSRAKKIKMYVDDEPYAILNLEDKRAEQTFKVEPIGNGNRADFEKLKAMPNWTIKFEILEVYQGDKYEDVAITEIYFDGLDVH